MYMTHAQESVGGVGVGGILLESCIVELGVTHDHCDIPVGEYYNIDVSHFSHSITKAASDTVSPNNAYRQDNMCNYSKTECHKTPIITIIENGDPQQLEAIEVLSLLW